MRLSVALLFTSSTAEPREVIQAGKVAVANPEPVIVTVPMTEIVRHRYPGIRSLGTSSEDGPSFDRASS